MRKRAQRIVGVGSPGRRRFLTGSAGLTMLALSACGGNSSKTQPTTASSNAPSAGSPGSSGTPSAARGTAAAASTSVPSAASKAVRGGKIIARTYREAPPWGDPQKSLLYEGWAFSGLVYSAVIQQDPYDPTHLRGDLASKWESPDPTTVVFSLQSGVTWHDSKPFSSQDVVYSLKRLALPEPSFSSFMTPYFASVDSIEASDNTTVRVKLKYPSASFLSVMSSIFSVVLPQHVPIEQQTKAPIGTGAFKYTGDTAGPTYNFARHETYFEKDEAGGQLPYLDGLQFRAIADTAAAVSAFKAGDLDWTGTFPVIINSDNWPDVQRAQAKAQRESYPQGANRFHMNVQALPDVRIRQALSLALDRKELSSTVYGTDSNAAATDLNPISRWSLPEKDILAAPGYKQGKDKESEIAQAKSLLAAAGYPDGYDLRFTALSSYKDQMEAITAQYRRAGVRLNIELLDTNTQYDRLRKHDFVIHYSGNEVTVDDPTAALTVSYHTGAAGNYGQWSDPQVDDMLDKQERELDSGKRQQLAFEIQRKVLGNNWVIWPGAEIRNHALSERVMHFPHAVDKYSNIFRWSRAWKST
jgi:peptide/nickel transport system substrate-binding protein